MSILEIIATVCGLIQGVLILLKKKENWIFYFGNIGILTIYSFFIKLYGDVIENALYIVMGIFGTMIWHNGIIITGKTVYTVDNIPAM